MGARRLALGTVHSVEEFLPGMVVSGRAAHVLNTASMNGYVPNRGSALYSTAKYGVVGLSDTLRPEPAGALVGVTVPAPSAVRTNIGRTPKRSGRPGSRVPVRIPPTIPSPTTG